MELVYLWVEDYKNIHKQGFNFSPKFNCDYDEKTNKLTIDENDDYIENFFGDNINVTAIVGKNGSGKSSVSEILYNIFHRGILLDTQFILIWDKNYYSNIKNLDFKNGYLEDDIFSLQLNTIILSEEKKMNNISLEQKYICKMIVASYPINKHIQLSSFMYYPNIIEASVMNFDSTIREEINYMYETTIKYIDNKEKIYEEENDVNSLLENITNNYHKFLFILYIIEYKFDIKQVDNLSNVSKLIDFFKQKNKNIIDEEKFNKYFEENNKLHKKISDLTDEEKEIYLKKYPDFFEFNFIDSKGREYQKLSYGERTFLAQFLNINFYINTDTLRKNNDLLIIFDEPEVHLHPNWQKNYIYELQTFLSQFNKQKFHFLFMSHSPFLLSDIPKQNIIFLDKYENGNCKVVNGLTDKKQTFGTNIHTLLSDSFFMEDGLMGEFAKGKIDDLISYLNDEKSTIKDNDEAQKLLNIIGEPIIKNQLQRMLDSKRLKKVDKIDKMERDIISLQRELRRLKNDKE